MQGVFTTTGYNRTNRFPSKKAFRDTLASGGDAVLEATSLFGNEYDGLVSEAPDGTYYVVGPDPYISRKWYAQVIVTDGKAKVK